MREIVVRFTNKEGLELLSKRLKYPLTESILEFNLSTGNIKYKTNHDKPAFRVQDLSWQETWFDMPEHTHNFHNDEYHKIIFRVAKDYPNKNLSLIFNQNVSSRTKRLWFPKDAKVSYRDLRFVGGTHPKYPVYIISKGRPYNENWTTSQSLSRCGINHFIVVEPQEVAIYKKAFKDDPYTTILELDTTYKDNYNTFNDVGKENSTGPGAARNFCWDDSIKRGFSWHWVMDDNAEQLFRYYRGQRIVSRSPDVLSSCERFVDKFDNIAIAGLDYTSFIPDREAHPAYILNTRIYSFLLIRNDIPYRWRGRYNEDTDLSLCALHDGWCTVQFIHSLAGKLATQTKGGGNTAEFYAKEGTINKSQMLKDMWPQYVNLVTRFGRAHHYVDYKAFFRQSLQLNPVYNNWQDLGYKDINNGGQFLVRIPEEWKFDPIKDTADYILNHLDEVQVIEDDNYMLEVEG